MVDFWGDAAPNWAAAIGTIGATWVALSLARREGKRQRQVEATERRAQALNVKVTGLREQEYTKSGGGSPVTEIEGHQWKHYQVWVDNQSAHTITDVEARLGPAAMAHPAYRPRANVPGRTDANPDGYSLEAAWPYIGPGQNHTLWFRFSISADTPVEERPDVYAELWVTFRDSDDRRWQIDKNLRLTMVLDPPTGRGRVRFRLPIARVPSG